MLSEDERAGVQSHPTPALPLCPRPLCPPLPPPPAVFPSVPLSPAFPATPAYVRVAARSLRHRQGHRLWPERVLQRRGSIQRHRRQRLLRGTRGEQQRARARAQGRAALSPHVTCAQRAATSAPCRPLPALLCAGVSGLSLWDQAESRGPRCAEPRQPPPTPRPTPVASASQVLRRKYSKEADIWSCGVILYILLCGVPPFYGDSEQQIFEQVIRGELDLSSDPWPKISPSAKDVVRRMLTREVHKRATAGEVLQVGRRAVCVWVGGRLGGGGAGRVGGCALRHLGWPEDLPPQCRLSRSTNGCARTVWPATTRSSRRC